RAGGRAAAAPRPPPAVVPRRSDGPPPPVPIRPGRRRRSGRVESVGLWSCLLKPNASSRTPAPNLADVAGEARLMIGAELQLIPLDDVGARLPAEQTRHQPEPLEQGAGAEVVLDHFVAVAGRLGAN